MKKVRLSLWISTLLTAFFIGGNQIFAVDNKAELTNEQASRQEDIKEFLNCRVVPQLGNLWDYTFEPGKFPDLDWDRP